MKAGWPASPKASARWRARTASRWSAATPRAERCRSPITAVGSAPAGTCTAPRWRESLAMSSASPARWATPRSASSGWQRSPQWLARRPSPISLQQRARLDRPDAASSTPGFRCAGIATALRSTCPTALAGDLGHVLAASRRRCADLDAGCAADVGNLRPSGQSTSNVWRLQAAGGDDYELCVCLPAVAPAVKPRSAVEADRHHG